MGSATARSSTILVVNRSFGTDLRVGRSAPRRNPRRVLHACFAGSILWGCVAAAPAQAQQIPAELPESWMSSWPDGPATTGVVPSVWLDRGGLGLTIGGTLAIDLKRSFALAPGVPAGGMLLELGAYGSGATLRSPRSSNSLWARFPVARPTAGVWLASSGFQTVDESRTLPSLGTGLWLQHGPFTFTAQFMRLLDPFRIGHRSGTRSSFADTNVVTGDPRDLRPMPIEVDDVRLLNGTEASILWVHQSVELQSRVGLAIGERRHSARWGEIGATYWVRPRIACFARARGAAEVPSALAVVRGSRVAMGVQLAPGRSPEIGSRPRARLDQRFRLERAGADEHRIRLSVPGSRLEVRSDATGWNPIEARRLGSDRWEVVLAMSPGLHRIEIRIDGGAWRAPPGVPTAADEFGGEVGLMVVD